MSTRPLSRHRRSDAEPKTSRCPTMSFRASRCGPLMILFSSTSDVSNMNQMAAVRIADRVFERLLREGSSLHKATPTEMANASILIVSVICLSVGDPL